MYSTWHYDNTYKGFTCNNFTYNINKFDITFVFLFTVISNVIYMQNPL
jgi:hypothetical protein